MNSDERNSDLDDSEEIEISERILLEIDEALAKNQPLSTLSDTNAFDEQPQFEKQLAFIRLLRDTLPSTGSEATALESFSVDSPLEYGMPSDHQLGHFQLLRLLGCGGCGMVYLANDLKLNRQVALKIPRPDIMFKPTMRQRFLNEARAGASLDHPNIVAVYEVGDIDGVGYFSSTYCQGGSLADWLSNHSEPLPPRTSASLIAQLADAVHFAHCRGILHRDIKPNNILLVPRNDSETDSQPGFQWIPKLIDFGLAKVKEEDLTQTGDLVGTLRYMAPEMFCNSSDARSDVYGLGLTLYELVTWRPAHDATDRVLLIKQVMEEEPIRPGRICSDLPLDLETIILKSIERDPERRYQHAGALADDLRRFCNDFPISARPIGSIERGWRWCRRNRLLSALIMVVFFSLSAAVIATVVFGVSQYWSNEKLRVAKESAERSQQKTAEMAGLIAWEKGRDLCNDRKVGLGMLWMARALETMPPTSQDYNVAIRKDISGWIDQCHHLEFALAHPQAVTSSAFSQDGRSLLTGCSDGVARIWDLETGRLRLHFLAHSKSISSVSYSPDGKTILTTGIDGTAKLWESDSGNPTGVVLNHPPTILTAAWSPFGNAICTGGQDGRVRTWDLKGRELGEALITEGPVESMDYSPDGSVLAIAGLNITSAKGEVSFWNFSDRTRRPFQLSSRKRFRTIKYSPGGQFVLTGDDDWEVNLWNSQSCALIARLMQDGNASSVAFAPDGLSLLLGSEDTASASLIDLKSLQLRRDSNEPVIFFVKPSHLLHRGAVLNVNFSHNGRDFVTAGNDGVARVWKREPAAVPELHLRMPVAISALAIDSLGQVAAFADISGTVSIWRMNDATSSHLKLPHPLRVNALGFTPNGRQLVTGCVDGIVRFWDIQTGEHLDTDLRLESAAESLAISSDGKRLLVGCENGSVTQFDFQSHVPIGATIQLPSSIVCMAFDVNGLKFVVGTNDGQVVFYNDGIEQTGLKGNHRGRINRVTFNHSGTKVITGSADGTAVIWDCVTGNPLTTFVCGREVTTALFSSDEQFVLLAGFTGQSQLWSVATTKAMGVPFRHPDAVTRAVFCEEDRGIITACWDGGVRLWKFPIAQSADVPSLVEYINQKTGLRLSSTGVAEMLQIWTTE